MDSTITFARVRVTDIPNLDAPPAYRSAEPVGSVPQIILPSGHRAAHLTRYNDVRSVLSSPTISRKLCNVENGPTFLPGPTQKELLLNLDLPEHRRSRRLVNEDFGPRNIGAIRDLIDSSTRTAIRKMLVGETPPDVFASVLDDITSRVIFHILGLPLSDRDFVRPWTRVIQLALPEEVPEIENAVMCSTQYLLEAVRGERPTDVNGFIRRQSDNRDSDDPLSDEEIVGVLSGILIGGDNNALSVMTKILYSLLEKQDLWDQLVKDQEIIPDAVEELIRLIPIGLLSAFPRLATVDIETSVGVIAAGTPIYPDAFLACRDPDVFHDPLLIDFKRRGPPHLQFGHGPHFCMGPHLARLEITTVLRALAEEVPSLTLDADPVSLRWRVGSVLRRPDELPVRWAA